MTTENVTVGMDATQIMWSDRNAYTVVEILAKNKIVVQRDIATRKDNGVMSDCQEYNYERDLDGVKQTLIKTKNGWKVVGVDERFILGHRETYYDFTF